MTIYGYGEDALNGQFPSFLERGYQAAGLIAVTASVKQHPNDHLRTAK